MPDLKISELTAATDIGSSEFEIVQGGTNKRAANTLLYTPPTNDGAALGTTSLQWSDLFLASGGVINFNNGDVTLTHATDALTVAGATSLSLGTSTALTAGTIELGAATDTTLSRGAAGFIAVEDNRVPSPASQAPGDILYRGATEWERLAKGTAAQVLTMNAGATAPEWAAPSAAGWDTSSQTWQSVTRNAGTSYQNSTAQPIQISARVSCAGTTTEFAFEVSPNNSTWTTIMQFTGSGASAVVYAVVACVIPPNLYYRRRNVAGSPSWINAVELR